MTEPTPFKTVKQGDRPSDPLQSELYDTVLRLLGDVRTGRVVGLFGAVVISVVEKEEDGSDGEEEFECATLSLGFTPSDESPVITALESVADELRDGLTLEEY